MLQSFTDVVAVTPASEPAPSLVPKLVAMARQGWARAQTRRALSELSAEQLADIGIDPSSVRRPVQIFRLPPGLITNLISMR